MLVLLKCLPSARAGNRASGQRVPVAPHLRQGRQIGHTCLLMTLDALSHRTVRYNVATILYIEDDEAIRQLVRLILERRSNIKLFEAATGSEGLSLAFTVQPDLILLDISLPDMNGGEVLNKLQNNTGTASIPVIAISGNSVIETQLTTPGFQQYLAKPINIQDLYTAIDSFIE